MAWCRRIEPDVDGGSRRNSKHNRWRGCVGPQPPPERHGEPGWRSRVFDGKVVITNDVVLSNADCAEDFDVTQPDLIEPGTVLVIEETGALRQSCRAYEKKVAGVVSGAAGHKPGIVLGRQDSQVNRVALALLGKVYCKVDAQCGSIEVGDLLTTSSNPGYAMKAADPLTAFGAVIGKALRPLDEGQGLVPMLIALQ